MYVRDSETDDIVRAFVLALIGGRVVNDSLIDKILEDKDKIKEFMNFAEFFDKFTAESPASTVMPGSYFDFFEAVKINLNLIKKNHKNYASAYYNFKNYISRFGNDLVIYDSAGDEDKCIDIFGNHWEVEDDSEGDRFFRLIKKGEL
jgi:hypothetical protein